MIFTTTRPQSNPERETQWRSAYSVFANREPFNSGRPTGCSTSPGNDGSAAFFSDDYQPEMADCRGY